MAPLATPSASAHLRTSEGQSRALLGSAQPPGMSKASRLRAYRDMLLVRRFEEKAGQLYSLGTIGGFCHLCIGQEAVVVGVQMALQPCDQVVATHRNHGQLLALGIDPKLLMAELTGRRSGLSGGRGGSMHPFAKERGFYGGHGIVGASIPIAAGLAFANQYRGTGAVAVGYMGDGASYQGQVAETFALASKRQLPMVFVIENNSTVTCDDDQSPPTGHALACRGVPFGIPGARVNGTDVEAVIRETQTALAHARVGYGPYVLEMLTCRYRGHSMSDPGKYGCSNETTEPREKTDPLLITRGRILDAGDATEADLKLIDREVRDTVNAAASFARDDAEPDPRELTRFVCL